MQSFKIESLICHSESGGANLINSTNSSKLNNPKNMLSNPLNNMTPLNPFNGVPFGILPHVPILKTTETQQQLLTHFNALQQQQQFLLHIGQQQQTTQQQLEGILLRKRKLGEISNSIDHNDDLDDFNTKLKRKNLKNRNSLNFDVDEDDQENELNQNFDNKTSPNSATGIFK